MNFHGTFPICYKLSNENCKAVNGVTIPVFVALEKSLMFTQRAFQKDDCARRDTLR